MRHTHSVESGLGFAQVGQRISGMSCPWWIRRVWLLRRCYHQYRSFLHRRRRYLIAVARVPGSCRGSRSLRPDDILEMALERRQFLAKARMAVVRVVI